MRYSSILAENLGKVVDREAILNAVWGDSSYANSLALNVQITYLRKLLDDPSVKIISLKRRATSSASGNPYIPSMAAGAMPRTVHIARAILRFGSTDRRYSR